MSVIVWDGRTLVVDSEVTDGSLRSSTFNKAVRKGDVVAAIAGDMAPGLALQKWAFGKRSPSRFPESADTTLVVVTIDSCIEYNGSPHGIETVGPYAWGAGAHVAIGALDMGADAEKAAKIACMRVTGCGEPLHVFNMRREPKLPRKPATTPVGERDKWENGTFQRHRVRQPWQSNRYGKRPG